MVYSKSVCTWPKSCHSWFALKGFTSTSVLELQTNPFRKPKLRWCCDYAVKTVWNAPFTLLQNCMTPYGVKYSWHVRYPAMVTTVCYPAVNVNAETFVSSFQPLWWMQVQQYWNMARPRPFGMLVFVKGSIPRSLLHYHSIEHVFFRNGPSLILQIEQGREKKVDKKNLNGTWNHEISNPRSGTFESIQYGMLRNLEPLRFMLDADRK